MPPAFILVTPQLGENIGAVARVMANFGLADLRLAAPRDGWPNPAAEVMSAGALPDRVKVAVHDALEGAAADCSLLLATTARPRGMQKPVIDAAEAIRRVREAPGRAAILFGGERAGLPNEAVALCDAIVTLPVAPGFASLNLAQAAGVMAHEWARAASARPPAAFLEGAEPAAPREELIGMFEHFEAELDRAGFFHPPEKRSVMVQNLRNAFTRAGWTSQEVRTFRGAVKALTLGRGKARIQWPD